MNKIARHAPDILAILVIFAAALVVYAPVLAPGKTLLPTDLVVITPPWRELGPTIDPDFTHVLRRTWDPLFQFYPARKFLADSLKEGWIPLWNPHIFSGTPFAADGQSAVFYPINWFFAVLPTGFAFSAVAFLHSFLTGSFFYAYSRRLSYSYSGSVAGAVVWMLCGIQVGWQMWQVVDSVLCWLPLCLYFWEGLRESGDIRQGVGFSFAVAMTVLAGHLQFAFYVLLLTATYALYRPITGNGVNALHSLMSLAGFGLLGILLSSVQLLATADLLRQSIRSSAPISALLPSALPPSQLALLIMPEIFGGERNYIAHSFLVGDYYEKVIYCGAAALVFALFALRLNKRGDISRYWTGVAVFALLMGCGTPLYNLFYYAIPLYRSFHGLSRVFVLCDFAVAALAAQGISLLEQEPIKDRKRFAQMATGLSFVIALLAYRAAALGNDSLTSYFLTHDWLKYGLTQAAIALLFIAAAAAVLFAIPMKYAWVALPIVLADMLLFAVGFNPGGKSSLLYPPALETDYVTQQMKHFPVGRVLSLADGNPDHAQSRLVPNSVMSLGWNDVSGSDPLILSRYDSFIKLVNLFQSGQQEPAGQGMIADAGSPALDALDVRWIVSARALRYPLYSLGFVGNVEVYNNEAALGGAWLVPNWTFVPGSARDFSLQTHLLKKNADWVVSASSPFGQGSGSSATEPTPAITIRGPGRLTIQSKCAKPALLIVSQTACPGWQATLDGKPARIVVVDSLMEGVFAPPGTHRISLAYAPDAIRVGLYGICAGWLLMALLYVKSAVAAGTKWLKFRVP